MLKKFILSCFVFMATINIANAGSPYLGLGVGAININNYFGAVGKIFGGYGLRLGPCCNYYLAGEVFVDGYYNTEHNCHCRYGYRRHHNSNNFNAGVGISVLPGIFINPWTVAFARIGLKSSNSNTYWRHSHHWNTGTQVGLGLQTCVAEHWLVRGEYIYTGCGIFNNFNYRRSNEVDGSVIYSFC